MEPRRDSKASQEALMQAESVELKREIGDFLSKVPELNHDLEVAADALTSKRWDKEASGMVEKLTSWIKQIHDIENKTMNFVMKYDVKIQDVQLQLSEALSSIDQSMLSLIHGQKKPERFIATRQKTHDYDIDVTRLCLEMHRDIVRILQMLEGKRVNLPEDFEF